MFGEKITANWGSDLFCCNSSSQCLTSWSEPICHEQFYSRSTPPPLRWLKQGYYTNTLGICVSAKWRTFFVLGPNIVLLHIWIVHVTTITWKNRNHTTCLQSCGSQFVTVVQTQCSKARSEWWPSTATKSNTRTCGNIWSAVFSTHSVAKLERKRTGTIMSFKEKNTKNNI